MEWNNLGTVTPVHTVWIPFTATASNRTIFRLSFAAPRGMDNIQTFAWLAFRCTGGAIPLPPSLAFRVFPDARGRLAEILYPQELISLGYTNRIFEIKRNRFDANNWAIQIEELIP